MKLTVWIVHAGLTSPHSSAAIFLSYKQIGNMRACTPCIQVINNLENKFPFEKEWAQGSK